MKEIFLLSAIRIGDDVYHGVWTYHAGRVNASRENVTFFSDDGAVPLDTEDVIRWGNRLIFYRGTAFWDKAMAAWKRFMLAEQRRAMRTNLARLKRGRGDEAQRQRYMAYVADAEKTIEEIGAMI